ncbi:MAG: AmmeMemoRadiSam system radical SAM enzyme [FCB group bacterium]|nr:AmmeMemoRadiSam system radical SAM enzyme [FCB group bacterium]
MIKPAKYFEKLENDMVICHLCPAECRLTPGKTGICGSRFNEKGQLVTDNYGELVTIAIDPIEKKPLYHFYPGREILSTGPNGCNFACINCQNWEISQKNVKTIYTSPEQLVATAVQQQSIGVAFTYTEPMIWFEYIMDVAPLLRKNGLKVVLISNGYINPQPLDELLPYIDAINVDLKAISSEFYKKVCKAKLEPVLNNIRTIAKSEAHLELTNLIIPTKNDSDEDLTALVDFVASLSPFIPLHFSAYYPNYKLDIPATPKETLLKAKEIAQKKLKYVYLGNIFTTDGANTYCPQCGRLLIKRTGYHISVEGLTGSYCKNCHYDTQIIQ